MRNVIGAGKLLIFALSALVTIIIQTVTLTFITKGPKAFVYPRLYHAFLCRLFGLKVIVEGEIEKDGKIVYVGNHVSYLDIEVLGSVLEGAFVAKKEVESWPLFGLMGKMQRTVYISRNPQDAAKEIQTLLSRLNESVPLIIFPEGTSSDGKDVLPFKTSFFEIFLNQDVKIQPFTISLIEMDGAPVDSQERRDRYAWHGDMTLEPHLWSFAKSKGAVVKVKLHESVLANSFNNRKLLSAECRLRVASGLDLSRIAA